MSRFAFTVPGAPVTWKRARRGLWHSYTDPAAAVHMDKIRACARKAGWRKAKISPFKLSTRFYKDIPPWDRQFGDLDNLFKIVKDALSGFVWVDDRWVTRIGDSGKFLDANARTEIEIEELTE